MSNSTPTTWLKTYYALRAGVSIAWVAAAFTLAKDTPVVDTLLIAYPAWDAVANLIDARQSGGLRANPSQVFNAAVSAIIAVAVAVALTHDMHAVIAVFGAWAALSGILQLITGIRRWKSGGQWAMVLSGAQSTLAGGFFISLAFKAALPGITDIAPYAGFGAFYFAISAIWLLFKKSAQPA